MRSTRVILAALVTLAAAVTAAGPRSASPDRAGMAKALATRAPVSRVRPIEGAPPALVTLEAAAESTETAVVLRDLAPGSKPRVLGTVPHAIGAARRASIAPGRPLRAFVVAGEVPLPARTTYGSALFRVEEGVPVVRLRGGLTNASRPLVTASGLVVVQAGRDGLEPEPQGKALRERSDSLTLEVVDPAKGTSRAAWSGEGMIAFLAAPLAGDEVLVFHVHAKGASLFALDARRGSVRTIVPSMTPLARDFSYDPLTETIAFVRAAAEGSAYEVVTVPARGGPRNERTLAVRYAGASDRLMPKLLPGGDLAVSLPEGRGLAWLGAPGAEPVREAPFGDGVDEVLAAHGPFLAIRHRTATDERTAVFDRASRRPFPIAGPELEVEVAGFAAEGAR